MSKHFKNYRHWRVEEGEDGVLGLVFDREDRGANALSSAAMEELDRILDTAAKGRWKGLMIRSGKEGGFIAGADVTEFGALSGEKEAHSHTRRGQGVFAKLEKLPFPTVALIHGYCLGGGLELALACRYRVASDGAETRLGLPEVQLGIHPGFGGTVRLTRLVGALAAMDLMLTGRSVSSKAAKAMGLVDSVAPHRHLARAGRALLEKRPSPGRPSLLKRFPGLWPLRPLVARTLQAKVARRAREEHYPAPHALVRLWRDHAGDWEAMYAAEAHSVARLVTGPTARNLVRVFHLQERLKGLAKVGAPAPRYVHVAGGGAMGGDIAAWCALQGMWVTVQDVDAPRLGQVVKRAAALFRKKLKDPRLVQGALDRLTPDPSGGGAARADVVIEAIFEDAAAKMALYRDLEPRMKPGAILATNTSSIPLEILSRDLQRPGRFAGLHFFNPVAKMQLVEVVTMPGTPRETLEKALAFVGAIRRLPLPVTSSPGFLVNRVLMPYLLEAVALEGEGVSAATIDQAAVAFGMPMGPVQLADTVGLDVCLSVARILGAGEAVPPSLEARVQAGHLGVKTGRGFYEYRNGVPLKPSPAKGGMGMPAQRLRMRLLNEVVACHRERVTQDGDLLDAGVIFGTGFAPFLGGPLHYNRQETPAKQTALLEALAARFGGRFQPDPGWHSIP